MGVGYRFDDPVAIEVSYVTGDSSVRHRAATSADVDVWSISALYHFLETDNISPFLIMGVGEQDISLADQGSESHVNAGWDCDGGFFVTSALARSTVFTTARSLAG